MTRMLLSKRNWHAGAAAAAAAAVAKFTEQAGEDVDRLCFRG